MVAEARPGTMPGHGTKGHTVRYPGGQTQMKRGADAAAAKLLKPAPEADARPGPGAGAAPQAP